MILIVGHAQHGKDTVAKLLLPFFGMKYEPTSVFVAEKFMLEFMAQRGFHYKDKFKCYEDRVNHRPLWIDGMNEYLGDDRTRLVREFGSRGYYIGLRQKDIFDQVNAVSIFVDASKRMPPDPDMEIAEEDCDFVIDNNINPFKDIIQTVQRIQNAHLQPNYSNKRTTPMPSGDQPT